MGNRHKGSMLTAALAFAAHSPIAPAQCEPDWQADFGVPGMNQSVDALLAPSDFPGVKLIAGGQFTSAGGVAAKRIAAWDGENWSSLADGMDSGVFALAVFDDGSGPALFAGGLFVNASGVKANHVAKWDGESWSALGSGLNGPVYSLAVFDDGSGPALYAGGAFEELGGATSISRWDGASWSEVGYGLQGLCCAPSVSALTVYDMGNGPRLFAGGDFDHSGDESVLRVAQWNGVAWLPLGSGSDANVPSLLGRDDGTGPALYAGGSFSSSGVGKWNGKKWEPIGDQFYAPARALTTYDDGHEVFLVAGGSLYQVKCIALWDGSAWVPMGQGTNDGVHSIANTRSLGGGSMLVCGGSFSTAGGMPASRIASWGCPSPPCYADFTGDGLLDLFDFLCFVNAFNAGCP